ncbi:hypothetical protein [Nocardia sp. NBC_00511]|uniref:hypothetical protein n=1 Tax=Nocardia sp. NBC_00511 TaxID=2903591 RepID=UPI0030DE7AE3
MKLRTLALCALAALPLTACTNSQQASDATSSSTAQPTTTSVAPCVDDNGHGPDGAPPCNPGNGNGVPLGTATEILMPADAVMGVYVPQSWGEATAGLHCEATDPTGAALTLNPPSPELAATKEIGGTAWTVAWTYGATPGKTTLTCRDGGSGRLPTDQGALFVRAIPMGIPMR